MRLITVGFISFIVIALSVIAAPVTTHAQEGLRVGPCPLSCRTLGIDKRHCKDWREGDTCYVEDTRYSKRPTHRPAPTPVPTLAPIRPPSSINPQSSNHSGPGYTECRRLSRFDIGRPYITIARVRPTGNVFGSKYKVNGSVEGMCLIEAGYFEGERKVSDIPVSPSRDFRRFEFEVTVRGDEFPELRVYTINGDREIRPLDRRDFEASSGDRYRDPRERPYDQPGVSRPPPQGPAGLLNELLGGGSRR